ncbi:unnamed protein product, partial [Closterium sp. NIES-54]
WVRVLCLTAYASLLPKLSPLPYCPPPSPQVLLRLRFTRSRSGDVSKLFPPLPTTQSLPSHFPPLVISNRSPYSPPSCPLLTPPRSSPPPLPLSHSQGAPDREAAVMAVVGQAVENHLSALSALLHAKLDQLKSAGERLQFSQEKLQKMKAEKDALKGKPQLVSPLARPLQAIEHMHKVRWCRVVQGGAGWGRAVQCGAGWCRVGQGGAGWGWAVQCGAHLLYSCAHLPLSPCYSVPLMLSCPSHSLLCSTHPYRPEWVKSVSDGGGRGARSSAAEAPAAALPCSPAPFYALLGRGTGSSTAEAAAAVGSGTAAAHAVSQRLLAADRRHAAPGMSGRVGAVKRECLVCCYKDMAVHSPAAALLPPMPSLNEFLQQIGVTLHQVHQEYAAIQAGTANSAAALAAPGCMPHTLFPSQLNPPLPPLPSPLPLS